MCVNAYICNKLQETRIDFVIVARLPWHFKGRYVGVGKAFVRCGG
jgi:hypothetical protein